MKVLVVDDEPLARERLLRLLADLRPGEQCWQASSGDEALALAAEVEPDLVLLDISMPGKDGIEVAAALDQLRQPPAIVFCTAHDEYALEALRQHAVAYLLKPVREAELREALATAGRVNRLQLANLGGQTADRRRVYSQTHRGVQTLLLSEVRCFVADSKYVLACSPTGELVLQDTLKELERRFGDAFVRVHRNALVSLAHVTRLLRDGRGGWQVQLAGVEHRPAISRRHLAEVKQRLLAR